MICDGLDAGPLGHHLGLAVINVLSIHGIQVHQDETGGPAETRVNLIIQGGTFAGYGYLLHT